MLYPTTEEVLQATAKTNVDWCIPVVKTWKQIFYTKIWSKKNDEYKYNSLSLLITLISKKSTNRTITSIIGTEYKYTPDLNLITLGPSPSIISTLHELGHAIVSHAEIDACAFSTAIFQQVFPKEYNKLEWHGHMLRRKKS